MILASDPAEPGFQPALGEAKGVDTLGGSSKPGHASGGELEPDQDEPSDDGVVPETPTRDEAADESGEAEPTGDTESTSDEVATNPMGAGTAGASLGTPAADPIDGDGEPEVDAADDPETDLEAPPADTMPLQCPPISVMPCSDGRLPSLSCYIDDAGDLQYVVGACPDATPPACEAPEGDEVEFLTLAYACAGQGLTVLRSEDEVREYCNLNESAPPTGVDFSTHAIYANSFAPEAYPLFVTDQGEQVVVGLKMSVWCSGNFPPSSTLMLRIPATDLAITEQPCSVGSCRDDGLLP